MTVWVLTIHYLDNGIVDSVQTEVFSNRGSARAFLHEWVCDRWNEYDIHEEEELSGNLMADIQTFFGYYEDLFEHFLNSAEVLGPEANAPVDPEVLDLTPIEVKMLALALRDSGVNTVNCQRFGCDEPAMHTALMKTKKALLKKLEE